MADMIHDQPERRPAGAESPIWPIILLGAMVVLIAIGILMNGHTADPAKAASHAKEWQTLLGVIATLAIFSILYKENPVFRFMEHIFIGLATGASFIVLWIQMIYPDWYQAMMPSKMVEGGGGKWWLIFELLIGLLFYTVYTPKLSWMNRFAIMVLMGWTAGYVFRGFMSGLMPQIIRSFKAPVTTYHDATAIGANSIHLGGLWFHPISLVFLIILFCTLAYFFFSVEHRSSWIRKPANAGRYFLMISLGAIFGTTVMGRLALAIDRLDFLVRSFTHWGHMLFR
ncbi:MAG TPA: hypothetical protein VHV83_12955 [Armatimonadota bacterium]|nr:hypothetical protein [Armatimonadota bacterium]